MAYLEIPSFHKNILWEQLPAAKLNDRGWKLFSESTPLVLSRYPFNRRNGQTSKREYQNGAHKDI
jgi:hypothetical protein